MTTATLTTPVATHEQVKTAILDALGDLEQRGQVYAMKVRGISLVARPLFPPGADSASHPAVVIP